MSTDIGRDSDPYLITLKNSLSATAVLKAELGSAKSSCESACIFAYEGVNDKTFYSHWLSKIQPKVEHEPFVCRNKDQLLRLWSSLKTDLTGMGENVYFFTDRDFDDLKGANLDNTLFMTELYSIENYLVDAHILKEILKGELHCHGNAEARRNILNLFGVVYQSFLEISYDINFRIFLSRRCNIRQTEEINFRLSDLANIQLSSVKKGNGRVEEMIKLEREPSTEEIAQQKPIFDTLVPKDRYRGKFALQFFRKWLGLLLIERNSQETFLFQKLPQANLVAKGTFTFDQLAAKCEPSESFRNFIGYINTSAEGAKAA